MARESDTVLKNFLERPGHPEGVFSFDEFRGFFFALICAPDLVKPSEWLPVVFGIEPEFESDEEVRAVMGAVMTRYNDLNSRLRRGRLRADVLIREPAVANLEEQAPLARWSRGFLEGHRWLEEAWVPYIEDDSELDREFASVLMALTFFADPKLAEAFTREMARPGKGLEDMAEMCVKLFTPASESYAVIGGAIWDVVRGQLPTARAGSDSFGPGVPKVGRNDPCPCGSGRKFKRCCWQVS